MLISFTLCAATPSYQMNWGSWRHIWLPIDALMPYTNGTCYTVCIVFCKHRKYFTHYFEVRLPLNIFCSLVLYKCHIHGTWTWCFDRGCTLLLANWLQNMNKVCQNTKRCLMYMQSPIYILPYTTCTTFSWKFIQACLDLSLPAKNWHLLLCKQARMIIIGERWKVYCTCCLAKNIRINLSLNPEMVQMNMYYCWKSSLSLNLLFSFITLLLLITTWWCQVRMQCPKPVR